MKYHKLSETQFYEMYEEFAVFLASQGINKEEWEQIKKTKTNKYYKELKTNLHVDKMSIEKINSRKKEWKCSV